MFVCRACLRSLSGAGSSPIESRLLRPLRKTASLGSSRRTYWGKTIQLEMRGALADPVKREEPPLTPKFKEGKLEAELSGGGGGAGRDGDEPGKKKYEKKLEWVVMKHLEHLYDPYHIAQHVSKALARGSFDEALMMTRIASREGKVEVSWNHLIDYQMKNKRLNAAIKLYNEMKKRAQVPNAKTYTIIFRGCAESLHPKLAVAETTRIYNFMVAMGALKPNTIHMNAALEVCARAGDLESLFTILKSANETLRAPDAHTFTIVLNALSHDFKNTDKGLGPVDRDAKLEVQQHIQRANAVWADVMTRWRGAKVVVDEHLVTAMGRVLLTGEYKDNESILDLVEQVMRIPRLDKVGGKLPLAPGVDAKTPPQTGAGSDSATPAPVSLDDAPVVSNLSPKSRRELAASRANSSPLYARPGPKTLSLVLKALGKIRKTSSAPKYWAYFTQSLGVTPDRDNYFSYLHALASGHASTQVAALVPAMPTEILSFITFRIAFGACVHDNLNKDSFRNACAIFDVMATHQRYADALALRLFLHAARANTRHFHEQAKTDAAGAKRAQGAQLVTALDRMWEPFRILLGSFSYPEEATKSPTELLEKQRGDMQEVMATARRMISAIDFVVGDNMTDKKTAKTMAVRRTVLQKVVERYILKLYPNGSNDQVTKDRWRDVHALENSRNDRAPYSW